MTSSASTTPRRRWPGQSAGELYGDIITDLKNNAFTGLGMDGVAYYSDSHTLTNADGVSTTYDNKLTAALSAASLSAVTASYGAARILVMGFKDEEGQPLGLIPQTCWKSRPPWKRWH